MISGFAAAAKDGGKTESAAKWPDGLTVDTDCPAKDVASEAEIAAQAKALVPLKEDLTLSSLWRPEDDDYDVECLTTIWRILPGAVNQSTTCSLKGVDSGGGGGRRTCRSDLRSAYMFHPSVGPAHPERMQGATNITLSSRSFTELKTTGKTRHRNLVVTESAVLVDLDGTLERQPPGTLSVIMNDRPVDLPVIRAAGTLHGIIRGEPRDVRIEAAILDDERFPLVLDYRSPLHHLTYTRITFPEEHAIERKLATEKRVDVYGIYFDFASDRIRGESGAVLAEIAEAMLSHPDWTLSIAGHTDNVGGDAFNLDLSRRRSESVRKALVRLGVAEKRLSTAGFGASLPKDTNETPKGRARNRRVELVRQ